MTRRYRAPMTAETLSSYCVPTSIASALGTSKLDAARLCLDLDRDAATAGGGVHTSRVAAGLGLEYVTVAFNHERAEEWERKRYGADRRGWGWSRNMSHAVARPTLAAFLRENLGDLIAIIGTGGGNSHAVHCRGGEVVADSMGRTLRRGRVRAFIPIPAGARVP